MTTETVPDRLIDPGKVLIGEVRRERSDRLDEVVGAGSGIGRSGWSGQKSQPRVVSAHLVGPTRIGFGKAGPELMEDADPNLGLEGDLVTKADPFEAWWQLVGTVSAKEAGEDVPELLGGEVGVHPNVVKGGTGGAHLEGVGHIQNFEIETGSAGLQHQIDDVGDLPLDGTGPLFVGDAVEAWQALNDDPVLLVAILNPIVELSVNGNLGCNLAPKSGVMALEVRHPVFVMSDLLLNL